MRIGILQNHFGNSKGMEIIHIPPGSLDDQLDRNPAASYLSQLAPGSRRTIKQSLNAIAAMVVPDGSMDAFNFPWHQLRYQHTAAIRAAVAERYAPATANKILTALKRCLKEAHRLGQITSEDHACAVDLKPIKSSGLLKGRALTSEELAALLATCTNDTSSLGLRDAAMLCVLRVGLRRSEVVKLDLSDFDPNTGALTIRGGKGGKDRVTYLPQKAIAHVQNWIKVRGDQPGPLLLQ